MIDDDDDDDDLDLQFDSPVALSWFFRCLSRFKLELHGPSRSAGSPLNTANPCMNPMFFFWSVMTLKKAYDRLICFFSTAQHFFSPLIEMSKLIHTFTHTCNMHTKLLANLRSLSCSFHYVSVSDLCS